MGYDLNTIAGNLHLFSSQQYFGDKKYYIITYSQENAVTYTLKSTPNGYTKRK